MVAGQNVTVEQRAVACTFTVTPGSVTTPAAGGSVSVAVNSTAGCAWTVTGAPGWVTASPANGTGSMHAFDFGCPEYRRGKDRRAVRGGTRPPHRAGTSGCAYTVTPDRFALSYRKQEREIQVATQSHCRWSATSSASWVRVSSETRTGSRELEVKVEENYRSEIRTAVVTIAGQNFTKAVTITQEREERTRRRGEEEDDEVLQDRRRHRPTSGADSASAHAYRRFSG